MKTPLFLTYGILLLAVFAYGQYNGWSVTRINQAKVSPKSIRDNPGAYRSIYGGYFRYIGGK